MSIGLEDKKEKGQENLENKKGNTSLEEQEKKKDSLLSPQEGGEGSFLPMTEEAFEKSASEAFQKGHAFQSYQLVLQGIELFPHSFKLRHYGALALLQTGALEEAKKILEPILPTLQEGKLDRETLTLIASIYKETWHYTRYAEDLKRARDVYRQLYEETEEAFSGAHAATLSWLLGEDEESQKWARAVIQKNNTGKVSKGREMAMIFSAVGLCHLILGEMDLAKAFLARVQQAAGQDYHPIVQTRQELKFLGDAGLIIPRELFEVLTPPCIVVFTGQMVDFQGQPTKHFVPEMEESVKQHIREKLDEIGARIGYTSASCGSDLLFIEVMLERGAEVNVVLPFDQEDFIAYNIRPAGPRWEARFYQALTKATSVRFATEEKYLGHSMLYRFANMVLHGMAEMRGAFLLSPPHLVAVWDSQPDSLVGGAADFIDHWSDIRTLHLIDLDAIKSSVLDETAPLSLPPHLQTIRKARTPLLEHVEETPRSIKTMLFSDLAGFSKLQEENIPSFLQFLEILKKTMEEKAPKPESLNTWGDAIFAVMEQASELAEYALILNELVPEISRYIRGLPPINIRISLHAGPVYKAQDPFRQEPNFYGGHINRAARLEPVTVIGEIYATEQFMALLTAEQSHQRVEQNQKGQAYVERFACEYVGVLPLAKGFGLQPVYHLRWI